MGQVTPLEVSERLLQWGKIASSVVTYASGSMFSEGKNCLSKLDLS